MYILNGKVIDDHFGKVIDDNFGGVEYFRAFPESVESAKTYAETSSFDNSKLDQELRIVP